MDRRPLNVTNVIDESPLSRFQFRVFLLCALIIFLDGIDYQVIGIAAPLISKEFGILRSSLGLIFGAGALGAGAGGLLLGLLADRLGRKRTLVIATLWFGSTTLAATLCTTSEQFIILRFLTGIGLGGAIPCCIALTSEYAPRHRRATIVSLLWAAFPLGAMVGGFINAFLVQQYGWATLFHVWGLIPVLVAAGLVFWMPESVKYLLTRGNRMDAARSIIASITLKPVENLGALIDVEERVVGAQLQSLFTQGRAIGTLSVWVALFTIIGSLTTVAMWAPSLITSHGFSTKEAALVVGLNGLGSFVGTASAGWLIERIGVARCAIPAFILAAVAALAFGNAIDVSFWALAIAAVMVGFFMGVGSSGAIAMSAVVYPTAIRSTGVGWANGMGRFGSALGPLVVGRMVGNQATSHEIFMAMATALLVAVPCVWVLAAYVQKRNSSALSLGH